MKTIVKYRNLRVAVYNIKRYLDNPRCILSYKVQIKFLFFWITIKDFTEEIYDEDSNFCKQEAIELFNNIINPYGKLQ